MVFQGRHFSTGHRILGNLSSNLDAKYAQMTYGEHYRKVSIYLISDNVLISLLTGKRS